FLYARFALAVFHHAKDFAAKPFSKVFGARSAQTAGQVPGTYWTTLQSRWVIEALQASRSASSHGSPMAVDSVGDSLEEGTDHDGEELVELRPRTSQGEEPEDRQQRRAASSPADQLEGSTAYESEQMIDPHLAGSQEERKDEQRQRVEVRPLPAIPEVAGKENAEHMAHQTTANPYGPPNGYVYDAPFSDAPFSVAAAAPTPTSEPDPDTPYAYDSLSPGDQTNMPDDGSSDKWRSASRRISVEDLFAAADQAGGLMGQSGPRPVVAVAAGAITPPTLPPTLPPSANPAASAAGCRISVDDRLGAANKAGGFLGTSSPPPGAVAAAITSFPTPPPPTSPTSAAPPSSRRLSVEDLFAAADTVGGFLGLSGPSPAVAVGSAGLLPRPAPLLLPLLPLLLSLLSLAGPLFGPKLPWPAPLPASRLPLLSPLLPLSPRSAPRRRCRRPRFLVLSDPARDDEEPDDDEPEYDGDVAAEANRSKGSKAGEGRKEDEEGGGAGDSDGPRSAPDDVDGQIGRRPPPQRARRPDRANRQRGRAPVPAAQLPDDVDDRIGAVEYQLLGRCVRTVSFLQVKVYVVGLYLATEDVRRLQQALVRQLHHPIGTTLPPAERETLRARLLERQMSATSTNHLQSVDNIVLDAFRRWMLKPVPRSTFPRTSPSTAVSRSMCREHFLTPARSSSRPRRAALERNHEQGRLRFGWPTTDEPQGCLENDGSGGWMRAETASAWCNDRRPVAEAWVRRGAAVKDGKADVETPVIRHGRTVTDGDHLCLERFDEAHARNQIMPFTLPDFGDDIALWTQIFGQPLPDPFLIEAVGDILPDRCRYKVSVGRAQPETMVFFRLAYSESTPLKLVKALADVATLVLGHLVPKHERTGDVRAQDGRAWEYLITEYVDQSVTMEDVWPDLQPSDRERLMSEVQTAVISLRSISRDDVRVQDLLPDLPIQGMGGGTEYGQRFRQDVPSLLHGLLVSQFPHVQPKHVSVMTDETSGEITVRADNLPTPSETRLTNQDCRVLLDRYVHFGHMDMEPRNILLRATNAKAGYQLAAIIDWEMAGFYPDGLEEMHKTTGFGACSIVWDWYDAYMNSCASPASRDPSVVKLMEAVCLIRISTELDFSGISKHLWVAYREKLEIEYDPMQMRMVRRQGASSSTSYSRAWHEEWESQSLEQYLSK
ncbi:MAG: hypothetical protein M1826_004573, partial [Phylliscum demangeonii]